MSGNRFALSWRALKSAPQKNIIDVCKNKLDENGLVSTNSQIAEILDISVTTVESWLANPKKSWHRAMHDHSKRLLLHETKYLINMAKTGKISSKINKKDRIAAGLYARVISFKATGVKQKDYLPLVEEKIREEQKTGYKYYFRRKDLDRPPTPGNLILKQSKKKI